MGPCTPCFVRPFSFALFVAFVLVFRVDRITALSAGLYHRDSYGSPFYDPALSKSEIIRRAIARSFNKSSVTPNAPTVDIHGELGEYFMKIRLGTAQVDILAVADTKSSLTWTQCQPCTRCLTTPLFDPNSSKSYSRIPCGPSRTCPPASFSQCQADGFCHYDIRYTNLEGAHSKGLLSTDTIQMDSSLSDPVNIPKYVFGCGTDNAAPYYGGWSGVVGLGAGPQSLVSQLGPLSMGRFSYCLTPFGSGFSHIHFGQDANVHGPGTVTIPMTQPKKQEGNSQYLATLEAFTVGKTRIEFPSVEEGNIAMDSGTPITKLPGLLYSQIRLAVARQTGAQPVSDPTHLLDLCFRKHDLKFPLPTIVANFKGGDIPLKQHNAFADMGLLTCLVFGVSDSSYSVYGSLAQQNFLVGFDTNAWTVSFKPFDCTNA